MAKPKAYGGAVLTGGGEGALDRPELDGDILNDLDLALVNTAGILHPYWLDDDDGGAESSPDKIQPDTNPGTKMWILQGMRLASLRVDNINIDGNTISSLDTDGDILLATDGAGIVEVSSDLKLTNGNGVIFRNTNIQIHSHNANELNIESVGANGSIISQATDYVSWEDEAANERMRLDTTTGNLIITGSILSSGGIITLGGTGGTYNENLIFDFESVPNSVVVSSSSGVNTIDFQALHLRVRDDRGVYFGTSSDARFIYESSGAMDSFSLSLAVGSIASSGYFSIIKTGDLYSRRPLAFSIDPVLRIYSADATEALDYIEFYHNQTDAIINGGNGNIELNPGDYVVLNSSKGTTGDPTGKEGMVYINTVDNVVKIYADGAWRTIASGW